MFIPCPTVLLLLLLILNVLASLDLYIADTRLEELHMYRGQYPCFEHNESGARTVLQFSFMLCNPSEEAVFWLPESERFLTARIDAESDVVMELPYLRDTHCLRGRPVFYRGSQFKLSPHCCANYALETNCLWLDVTNASLPDEFDLYLSLAGLYNASETVSDLELEHHSQSLVGPLLVPVVFLTLFLLCFMRLKLVQRENERNGKHAVL